MNPPSIHAPADVQYTATATATATATGACSHVWWLVAGRWQRND